jgi:hypothetical protein
MANKKESEDVEEIFEVKKDGKTKEIIKDGKVEVKHADKEQNEKYNKILKWILIGIVLVSIGFLATLFLIDNLKTFNYSGMKFDKVQEGQVLFYHTSFPVIFQGKNVTYNLYIRTDPRTFDNVPFNETITAREMTVINISNELNCNGDGVIAIANMEQLFPYIGMNMIQDSNASCDPQARYMFIDVKKSNQTSINKFGTSCYEINVNNCEILKATEKFIVEILKKRNQAIKSS